MHRTPVFANWFRFGSRQTFAALALAATVATGVGGAADRPNVLWITSEDNGPHLGCYGDQYATTPNLDQFAQRGMRYRFCWSNAPVCAPARTTIISGMYPPSLGAEHMRSLVPLPDGFRMYPQYLREAGYYCTNNSKEDYNLVKPGQVWDDSSGQAHWKNRTSGQPFFAIFNHTQSHESQLRTRPHQQVHDPAGVRVPAYHPDMPEVRQDWAQYYDKITEIDRQAGRNLRELEEAGLSSDTVVFYYGDHGSGMPRNKRWPYNSGLQVPLIVYIPDKFAHLRPDDYQAGGASERLVSFVDLAPTLLNLCGVAVPPQMQGHAFAGPNAAPPQPYVYGFRGRMDERYDLVRTVRDQRYVYVRNFMPHLPYGQHVNYMFQTPTTRVWKQMFDDGLLNAAQSQFWQRKPPEELYDLQADPDEVKNLAGAAEHAETLARMRAALREQTLRIRDVGFLPEGELHSRSGGGAPYDVGHDDQRYPLERILAAAELASSLKAEDTAALVERLGDADSAVRYWAATGLLAREQAGVAAGGEPLRQRLTDESPSVRAVAAWALAKSGAENQLAPSLAALSELAAAKQHGLYAAILAMNALDDLDQRAAPLQDRIATVRSEMPQVDRRIAEYIPRLVEKTLGDLKAPHDRRLEPLRDLNSYFPFAPPASAAEWEQRAAELRRDMLVSFGLWPLPTKCPLNAVIHGRVERDDYTVEKAYFEAMPGFYVTGSLYRPKGASGQRPGVLCPHGHWANGRFYDCGVDAIKRDIAAGAEQFEEGGRSPLQARCVQLARMGCVVFHYDMIGYADSVQLSQELAHGFSKQRPEMSTPDNWGLFSPQAESHSQNIMGLQTYSSIRALDFLSELPDVDARRLAVTGASGGGTQTFALGALDPRPVACFPAVMVSTAMQGGCTCENACGLRIRSGNVEFAALFAPKPIGLSAANDWTKEMTTKGFPELQRHFQLLGRPENVMLISRTEFGHNYNSVSRHAMYEWFNKHLGLNQPSPIAERDFQRLTTEQMSVWDADHPRPAGGPDFERGLLRWWHDDARQQLDQLVAAGPLDRFEELVAGGVRAVIGRGVPAAGEVTFTDDPSEQREGHAVITGRMQVAKHGEEIPCTFLHPENWNGRVVVWLDPAGKQALFRPDGSETAAVARLVRAGIAVVGIDLFQQGDFLADGRPAPRTRRVRNPREAAAYTFGYNDALFAQRVHDVLSLCSLLRHHDPAPTSIEIVGLAGAGHWASAAAAVAGATVQRAAIDTAGFRFGKVAALHDADFLPGGAKFGDVPGMLAAAKIKSLLLADGGPTAPELCGRVFAASGRGQGLEYSPQPLTADAVADWLLK